MLRTEVTLRQTAQTRIFPERTLRKRLNWSRWKTLGRSSPDETQY